MHIFDAIRSRRAVKYFDPEFKLSESEQTELLDLAACRTLGIVAKI